ncbi:DUF7386 family protein [Natronococcus jeotgali]
MLEEASEIVADGPDDDDPPMSDVTDVALTHLVESEQNIANTSVIGLRYRTRAESR